MSYHLPMKPLFKFFTGLIALASVAGFSSCTTGQQKGAQYGALAGVALGTLSGDNTENVLVKTGLGAALGAVVVALKEEHTAANSSPSVEGIHSAPVQTQRYPYGTRTTTPGIVKSPYSPYNVVNVEGIASGTKVTEPGSTNIFIVP